MGDTELIQFKPGKIVSGRWKIAEKLGSGGCGVVYEVTDINRKGFNAALKASLSYLISAHFCLGRIEQH